MILTSRQSEVLAFINKHRSTEQCNPNTREIARHFGWASENSAHEHLQALERKGAIVRRPLGRYIVQEQFIAMGVVS